MVSKEVINIAIKNIQDMIDVNIRDISKGGIYVRKESSLCLDLFRLIDKLEKMKKKK